MLKIVQSTYTDRAMEKQTKPKQRERRRGNEQPFRTKSRVKTKSWETTSRSGDCGQARKPFVLGKINESGMTRNGHPKVRPNNDRPKRRPRRTTAVVNNGHPKVRLNNDRPKRRPPRTTPILNNSHTTERPIVVLQPPRTATTNDHYHY